MDLKTFVLLYAGGVGPVLAAFENPTARSSQIVHCLDISQQTRAEFPAQKVKFGRLTPAGSRDPELVVLARPCVECKVGMIQLVVQLVCKL